MDISTLPTIESLEISEKYFLCFNITSSSTLSKSALKKLQAQKEKEERKRETAERIASEQSSVIVFLFHG